MAHPEQAAFCQEVKALFPEHFHAAEVLDVGSLDINGNNRGLFEGGDYRGVDIGPGPNVDEVSFAHEFECLDEWFDTIISTECFEHDKHYEKSLQNIVRMLKPGGIFLFTCATTGRGEHGTRRTSPSDSPHTSTTPGLEDYYKNLTEADIRRAIAVDNIFSHHEFRVNGHDLYFWGVKRG